MTTTLTYMIVLLGAATVTLSIYVAVRFFAKHIKMRGDGRRLTGALVLMLAGEAVLGLGTLCFAIAAHTGHLPHIPIELQSVGSPADVRSDINHNPSPVHGNHDAGRG